MVEVYVADISKLPDPKDFPEVLEQLPNRRKEKTLRYRQVKDRKQSLGAGLLLKKCLSEHGIDINNVTYNETGKPVTDSICFNLSHSHDKVVCVVSNQNVGCDIEKIGDVKEGIAERFFTEKEIQYLSQFTKEKKREEFYRIWTMKESCVKMTGEGISLALDHFEFEIADKVNVYRDGLKCECFIKEYDIPGYKLTVCAKEEVFAEEIKILDQIR